MTVTYQQTDNAVTFEVGCSGQTAGVSTAGRELIEGGSPGANDVTVDPDNNTEAAVFALATTGGTGLGTWQAGDYVVDLNIVGSNGNSVWSETHICERTAGGAFNTVASLTGQTTDVSAAGVVSHTVNRATDFTPAGTDSDLYIVIVFSNSDPHGNSTTDITPDQTVTAPFATINAVSGDVTAQDATTAGDLDLTVAASGAVTAQDSTAAGTVNVTDLLQVSGAVVAQDSQADGQASVVAGVSGAVSSQDATAEGSVVAPVDVSGAVSAQDAAAAGDVSVTASTSGAVSAGDATVAGEINAIATATGAVVS